MSDTLSIDLIICTYNHASLLDRTLTAIARQQVSPGIEWTVLVVNNNCTDNTVAVVEQHVATGHIPGLRMVCEPQQGLTPARLRGVKHTGADWLAFVDDDCLLEPGWIAEAATFALMHPDCGAFGGQVRLEWEATPPAFVLNFTYAFAAQDHGSLPKPVACLAGAGMVINRKALERTGWTEKQFLADRVGEKLISGGDVEIALRLAARYHLWYNPACTLRHIIPARRTSARYLCAINYGLGSSKLFGDTMLWSDSYHQWIAISLIEALRRLVNIVIQALRTPPRRGSAIEVAISLSFLRGWFAGIWRLWQMHPYERQALVGCARVTQPVIDHR